MKILSLKTLTDNRVNSGQGNVVSPCFKTCNKEVGVQHSLVVERALIKHVKAHRLNPYSHWMGEETLTEKHMRIMKEKKVYVVRSTFFSDENIQSNLSSCM